MDKHAKEAASRAPDTPHETMEFLARSWSLSAHEVSKALSPSCLVYPRVLRGSGANTCSCTIVEDLSAEMEDTSISFSFASSETSQMVMDRIMSQSDEASPRTSGRLSHSNGPLTESPPVSPSDLQNAENCRSVNHFPHHYRAMSSVAAGTSFANTAVVPGTGKTMGRWLKDRKEKKKEETRTQNAQLHAAISVAGVAAAVAAMAAATASSSCGSDERLNKTTMAVASAVTLVAAQCVEQAEAMGAERDHLASVVSSAVNVRSAGDVMTLTAAAATALRGAATLKARGMKDVWNVASVTPVERGFGGGSGSNGSSNGSWSGEPLVEDNILGACSRDLLARGCELLKRTRKGDLHWKIVSVYINGSNQVILRMKSRHIAGTITKKKKNVVLEVVKNILAWPGRHLVEGGEHRRYFGLKTVTRGVVEFECLNEREYEIWTQGVAQLLAVHQSRKHAT